MTARLIDVIHFAQEAITGPFRRNAEPPTGAADPDSEEWLQPLPAGAIADLALLDVLDIDPTGPQPPPNTADLSALDAHLARLRDGSKSRGRRRRRKPAPPAEHRPERTPAA